MAIQHNPRPDTATAWIVEQGIRIAATLGAANAWTFMTSSGVPLSVIKRVIGTPAGRRAYSASPDTGASGFSATTSALADFFSPAIHRPRRVTPGY